MDNGRQERLKQANGSIPMACSTKVPSKTTNHVAKVNGSIKMEIN